MSWMRSWTKLSQFLNIILGIHLLLHYGISVRGPHLAFISFLLLTYISWSSALLVSPTLPDRKVSYFGYLSNLTVSVILVLGHRVTLFGIPCRNIANKYRFFMSQGKVEISRRDIAGQFFILITTFTSSSHLSQFLRIFLPTLA